MCTVIPFTYALSQSIDFAGGFARVSGSLIGKNSIGYSLQLSALSVGRAFSMITLPLCGFLIDSHINTLYFLYICIASCFVSGMIQFFLIKNPCISINYFSKKIKKMVGVSDYVSVGDYKSTSFKFEPNIFLMGSFIYSISSTSIFVTFMLATVFTENKVMITQMSVLINALATMVLTIRLDPIMSIKLENDDGYISSHKNVMLARALSMVVICPSVYIVTFFMATS